MGTRLGGPKRACGGGGEPGCQGVVSAEAAMGTSQAEILRQITMKLEPFRKDAMPITGETDITRDLNLDSLTVMDFIMELEEKFDVSIPLNLVPQIQTVAHLAG